jgi:hypothetical protein
VLERLKLKAVEIPVHPRDGIDLGVLHKPWNATRSRPAGA